VYAGDGRLLTELAAERRVFVPIDAIPERVISAPLSAEDRNFYNHHGFDPVFTLYQVPVPEVSGGPGRPWISIAVEVS
jgi:membrane carboxypeptidase/penicillin-binding protein